MATRGKNIGIFVKRTDDQIPTPWVRGETWWFDVNNLVLKVWSGISWLDRTSSGGDTTSVNSIYVMAGTIRGLPAAGGIYLIHPVTEDVTIPAGGGNSRGKSLIAANVLATFSIQKNGAQVGTMNFGAGSTTATFTFPGAVSLLRTIPDVVTIIAPAVQDTTLANVGFAIHGTR